MHAYLGCPRPNAFTVERSLNVSGRFQEYVTWYTLFSWLYSWEACKKSSPHLRRYCPRTSLSRRLALCFMLTRKTCKRPKRSAYGGHRKGESFELQAKWNHPLYGHRARWDNWIPFLITIEILMPSLFGKGGLPRFVRSLIGTCYFEGEKTSLTAQLSAWTHARLMEKW